MDRAAPDTGCCTGACCAAFQLEYTLRQLRTRKLQDGAFIADMVIPSVPRRHANDHCNSAGKPVTGPGTSAATTSRAAIGTSRRARLCTVYDERPRMCSGYPYDGEACDLGAGCTCTNGSR